MVGHKLEIRKKSQGYAIFLDDRPLMASKVVLRLEAGYVPEAEIRIFADEISVDADVMVDLEAALRVKCSPD